MASRFGIQPQLIDDTLYDAFGQRQVAQYFTQLNTYDVIEEILPKLQGDPTTPRQALHPLADDRADGAAERLRQMDDEPGRSRLSISHQAQFPAVTISFNLAAGRRARPGDGGDPARRARAAAAARP